MVLVCRRHRIAAHPGVAGRLPLAVSAEHADRNRVEPQQLHDRQPVPAVGEQQFAVPADVDRDLVFEPLGFERSLGPLLAVAGDGLDSGAVQRTDAGATRLVAVFPSDRDPGQISGPVDFYAGDLDQDVQAVTQLSVAQGEDRKGVSKRTIVRYHTKELSDNAIIYRNGNQPITDSGTAYGQIVSSDQKADGTVIRTYTTESGEVTLRINNNPGFIDRTVYEARLLTLSLPLVEPGTLPFYIGGLASVIASVGGALAGRRWGLV